MTEQAIVVALRSRIVLGFMTELTQSHQINSVYNLENSKLLSSVLSHRRIVALEKRLLKTPRRRLKKSSKGDFARE
jgi:hypothetical protein